MAAKLKIAAVAHVGFSVLVCLVMLCQFIWQVYELHPTQFVESVRDLDDPALAWNAQGYHPALEHVVWDEEGDSIVSAATVASLGDCEDSLAQRVVLNFGNNSKDGCWRSVVHRQHVAAENSLRSCVLLQGAGSADAAPSSASGAGDNKALCCVKLLPAGGLVPMLDARIEMIQHRYIALWLALVGVTILSGIVTACFVVLQF